MPILSTSTSAFYERARSDMQTLRSQAETMQSQLSSGERLTRSSDNPVAASRLRALSRLETLSQIDTANAGRASADLSLADAALNDMADALIRAQELATSAASATLTETQRKAIGEELTQLNATLLSLANARDSSGHALFGGETGGDAYSLDASGNTVYVGTSGTGTLPLGEGQNVSRSITGPQALSFTDAGGTQTNIMAVIKTLADALSSATADPAGAAKDALTGLQSGLDTLTTAQTVVGTRLAWIDLTDQRRIDLQELRGSEEAEIGDTNLALTIATLQETMTVLEASQASFTRLAGLSLFSQLT